ncbi:MAG: hypothetical protein ACRDD8_12990, partial [Bacteroidales bacterium]
NILGTMKTVYVGRGKFFQGAVIKAISEIFYSLMVIKLAKDGSYAFIMATCMATFIGTLIAGYIVRRNERERLYNFDITCDTLRNGFEFADEIRSKGIDIKTYICYNNNIKTLSCNIYSKTKRDSVIVFDALENYQGFKYNAVVPKIEC